MARNQTMQGPSFPNPHLDLQTNNTEDPKYLKLKIKSNNYFRDRDKASSSGVKMKTVHLGRKI